MRYIGYHYQLIIVFRVILALIQEKRKKDVIPALRRVAESVLEDQ
jgi:hypothetical protein